MKTLHYLLIFVCFAPFALRAQEYKTTVQNNKDGKLTLVDFTGSMPIEGYSGNEIIITSNDDRFGTTPDRAKGLKAIYPGGTDNTGLGLQVEKNGNQITIKCLVSFAKQSGFKVKVPDNFSVKVTSPCERNNSVNVQNIKGELEVNICHSISAKNVSGPLVLSTISGEIEVDLDEIGKDRSISIATISGEIDVKMPAKAAVDLGIKTMNGSIYSDIDFPADNSKEIRKVGGGNISTKLNGGGADLKLTTISGNIYLRKK